MYWGSITGLGKGHGGFEGATKEGGDFLGALVILTNDSDEAFEESETLRRVSGCRMRESSAVSWRKTFKS